MSKIIRAYKTNLSGVKNIDSYSALILYTSQRRAPEMNSIRSAVVESKKVCHFNRTGVDQEYFFFHTKQKQKAESEVANKVNQPLSSFSKNKSEQCIRARVDKFSYIRSHTRIRSQNFGNWSGV